jgi:hypothetical protein
MTFLNIQREFQRLIAEALAEEAPDGDPLAPHMLAALLVAGNEAVVADWLREGRQFDPLDLLEIADYATGLFAGRLRPSTRKKDVHALRRPTPGEGARSSHRMTEDVRPARSRRTAS